MDLKRIIPLNQLNTLNIDCQNFCFKQFLRLLQFTPNIHTLTFDCQSISEQNSISIQQNEIFVLVSNSNIITNVFIKERYSSENIKLLVALCPRIQHLTIDTYAQHLQSIVSFILWKTKSNIQHLCSLSMKDTTKSIGQVLQTLIDSEKLLDNYLMELIDGELYIWW